MSTYWSWVPDLVDKDFDPKAWGTEFLFVSLCQLSYCSCDDFNYCTLGMKRLTWFVSDFSIITLSVFLFKLLLIMGLLQNTFIMYYQTHFMNLIGWSRFLFFSLFIW